MVDLNHIKMCMRVTRAKEGNKAIGHTKCGGINQKLCGALKIQGESN